MTRSQKRKCVRILPLFALFGYLPAILACGPTRPDDSGDEFGETVGTETDTSGETDTGEECLPELCEPYAQCADPETTEILCHCGTFAYCGPFSVCEPFVIAPDGEMCGCNLPYCKDTSACVDGFCEALP